MSRAAPQHEAQWPPRSPHEARMSTPSGRTRYRQMLDRTSPSPSPQKASARLQMAQADTMDIDDEEDEEILELKLQELQARLKLKKLQAAKNKDQGSSICSIEQQSTRPQTATTRTYNSQGRDENRIPRSETAVQVPASPVKKAQQPQEQTSPRRVQLGIDKGLKAKDISLKRAPSVRNLKADEGSQGEGYLRRSRTPNPAGGSFNSAHSASGHVHPPPSRPMSFNERLAAVRTDEASIAEKQKRIQQSRSKAFGVGREEMEKYKKSAVDIPSEPLQAPAFSRDEVLSKEWRGSGLRRSNTTPNIHATKDSSQSQTKTAGVKDHSTADSEGSFESYSGFHLSRRLLPHRVLARQVSGKKIMSIKDLLREVKAPDFSLPDVEQDIVVVGIVAKKSDPRAHKAAANKSSQKDEDRGKYMVISICDLEYEVDLFLFNSGFDRFWKLTEGTTVAILNPNIMPPPPGRNDTGKFSMVINSDEDTIMEIGMARDIGYCQSLKKDGNACGTWVNKKRTNFCEYHTNETLAKTRASRIVFSDASFGCGPPKKKNFKDKYIPKPGEKKAFQSKTNYDTETKSHWFVSRSMSAADLIDGKDQTAEDRKERQAFIQRNLEAKEKERAMMRRLGNIGNAAGREYMKQSGSQGSKDAGLRSSASVSNLNSPMSERELRHQEALKSLDLGRKDRVIELGTTKRKRPESSHNGTLGQSSSSTALGWGSGLKDKLARMKEGEALRKGGTPEVQPPVRKKTRFVTDKGIREAGRESLGAELTERLVSLDDDDDELIIVK